MFSNMIFFIIINIFYFVLPLFLDSLVEYEYVKHANVSFFQISYESPQI